MLPFVLLDIVDPHGKNLTKSSIGTGPPKQIAIVRSQDSKCLNQVLLLNS